MDHHSTDSELRDLWFGRLAETQADRIRHHLVACEKCLTRLIEIDVDTAGGGPPGEPTHVTDRSHPVSQAR
jgi:hypothetical protein